MVKKNCKRLTGRRVVGDSNKPPRESIKKYCTKKKPDKRKSLRGKTKKNEYLKNRKMPNSVHACPKNFNNKNDKKSLLSIENDVTLYEITPISPTKLSISVKKFYNNNTFKLYEQNLQLTDKKNKSNLEENTATDRIKDNQNLLKDVEHDCILNNTADKLVCKTRQKYNKCFNNNKPHNLNPQLNKADRYKNKRKSNDSIKHMAMYNRDCSFENDELQLNSVQSEISDETQTNDCLVDDYRVTQVKDNALSISVKRFYKTKVTTSDTDDNVNKDMPLVSDTTFNSKVDFNQSPLSSKLNSSHKISLNVSRISDPSNDNQQKVTAFFPIRRSGRKTKNIVNEEKQTALVKAIASQNEDGLKIAVFPNKGRGIVAGRNFSRGEYVVEYSGELIDLNEARKREAVYSQDTSTGCYMYYFKYGSIHYCIDATAESSRLGRLVNHSRFGNLGPKVIEVSGSPKIVFTAKNDIKEGEELTYDYGDRSKTSLVNHPWLAY